MRLISKFKSQSGFTLIEMSMAILITGLILGTTASYYGLYLKRENMKVTAESVTAVTNKISEFRNINGRYPAPASLTLPRGDADYGRENKTICTNVAKAPGTCENGICIKSNSRDADGNGTNETLRVCVGTIPFRQLNLSEKYAFDAYGSRLVYAVTEDLTDDAKFRADSGGIDMLKAQGTESALDIPKSAHFVVLSAGPDMAGGYTADGVQIACPSTGSQNANCNTGAAAAFRVAQLNQSLGNTAFDDVVNYFIRDPAPLWQISPDANAKAQGDMIMKPTDNLGARILIQDVDQALPNKMNVNGVMRASTEMISNQICDSNGANCFNASLLAGQLDPDANPVTNDRTGGMKCPEDDTTGTTGQYMVAIEHGAPVCEDEVAFLCPDGQVMTGAVLGAGGELECTPIGPPPPCTNCCPARDTTFCGRTYPIAAAGYGAINEVHDTGGNGGAWESWYCQGDGVWDLRQTNHTCGCTPQADTLYTWPCGSGFSGSASGSVTRRVAITCPNSAVTILDPVATANSCGVCNPGPESVTANCPAGTGTYQMTRIHDCSGYDPATHLGDTWTAWDHSAAASCPCTPGPVGGIRSCDGGLTGYIATEGTRSCPDGTVSGWHDVGNYCGTPTACDPNQTEPGTRACPTGYTRNPIGITTQRQRDCSTGGWGPWVDIASDCIAGPPTSCKWGGGTLMNSTPTNAYSSNERNKSCTCGSAPASCYEGTSSAAYNYSNCSCGG